MPDKVYVTRDGFVQFEPNVREVNGKEVTDVTIKTTEGTYFKITLWPEFLFDTPVKKGDWLAVDGAFESQTYQKADGSQATSNQISAYNIAHVAGVAKADRDVVATPVATNDSIPF